MGMAGNFYKHQLDYDNLPDPIPPQELDQLVERLRGGDTSVVEQIVEGHLRLACYMAARYSYGRRYKADDIFSTALYGMMRAINQAPIKLINNNITPYIVELMRSQIRWFLEKDHLIPVQRKEFKRRVEEKIKNPYTSVCLTMVVRGCYIDDDGEYTPEDVHMNIDNADYDNDKETDYTEFFEHLNLNEKQMEVLKYRLEGYSFEEIGTSMGFSKQYVNIIMNQIKEKYAARS